jgi:hypothetical protein
VSDTLPVHVNRQELHSLEVPTDFETGESFQIRLLNHGESVHVHLHLDDDLSEVASLEAANHYVEGESQRVIRVTVAPDATLPVHGRLKVVTAYGATTRYIDVDLEAEDEAEEPVTVDESLGQPQPRPTADTGGSLLERPELPVLALGGLALLVALLAVLVMNSMEVLVGALVVLGGVLVAIFFLLREPGSQDPWDT